MAEIAWATLEFSGALLKASYQVVKLQRDAAIVEQVIAERDAAGGNLQ
jgi:hypothetical protein